jgi:hypothetical protein
MRKRYSLRGKQVAKEPLFALAKTGTPTIFAFAASWSKISKISLHFGCAKENKAVKLKREERTLCMFLYELW